MSIQPPESRRPSFLAKPMQAVGWLALALLLVAPEAEGSAMGLDEEIQAARARRRALLAELVSLGDTPARAPLPPHLV